ncbi:MAG: hypothetical protein LBR98_09865 [Syntrophomonadaceae bacterium]|jgi:hypothetical protein|nr:hypothetical protein [Syntrophomonadaceae bacterium]
MVTFREDKNGLSKKTNRVQSEHPWEIGPEYFENISSGEKAFKHKNEALYYQR